MIAAHAYGYGYGYGYGHGAGETFSHSHNVCMGSGRKTLVASGVLAFYRLMLDASKDSARFEVLRNVEDVQERSIPLEDLESLMYDKSSGLFLVCLCAIHISYHPCFDPGPHKTPGLREICHDRRPSASRVLSYFHNH